MFKFFKAIKRIMIHTSSMLLTNRMAPLQACITFLASMLNPRE